MDEVGAIQADFVGTGKPGAAQREEFQLSQLRIAGRGVRQVVHGQAEVERRTRRGLAIRNGLVFGLAKLVMGVSLIAIGAFVFFSFNVGSIGPALVPIAAVLLVVWFAISMLVIGCVLRFGHGAEALAWGVMFVLMPLSGIFYPIDALPRFIRPIALALPTTYAFKALRGVVDGQPLDWGLVAIGAVGAVVLSAFATWFLIRMLRLFRRRGYVTRYS